MNKCVNAMTAVHAFRRSGIEVHLCPIIITPIACDNRFALNRIILKPLLVLTCFNTFNNVNP